VEKYWHKMCGNLAYNMGKYWYKIWGNTGIKYGKILV
jgi:hypothetical protein